MKTLRTLFLSFLKIGAFTFGGGYAMLALLENEFVSKKAWLDKEEFLDMVAIAESTPGPVAINSATYIGYRTAGFWGSLVSTLGVCIPSFVIIYGISLFFDAFLRLTYVSYAFRGIQVCVVYLIASAGVKVLKNLERNWLSRCIVLAVVLVMTAFSLFAVRFSSVFYILICGAIGLALSLCRKGVERE
ncbi:MAG: chromate transporter [Oscillospiraceae bacterium]|jgi:chromate transporter|nr:chromate transporter [Oscillospiraceae bacterium]